MSSNKETTIPVDLIVRVIGKWRDTYHWIPIFSAVMAFVMSFCFGANNIPIPFSASVGSGMLTFIQASVVACLIYIPGSAFVSNSTVDSLFTDFLQNNQPNQGFLMWSMVVVLITATLWLALATYLELPVSTQQSTRGALLGTMLVTGGLHSLKSWNKHKFAKFNGGSLVWILLEWALGPLVAFVGAFLLFRLLRVVVLRQENAEKRVLVFLPIYYGIVAGLLCLFLMYQVIPPLFTFEGWASGVATGLVVVLATLVGAVISMIVLILLARRKIDSHGKSNGFLMENPDDVHNVKSTDVIKSKSVDDDDDGKFEDALKDYMEMRVLETVYEEDEKSWASPNTFPVSAVTEEHQPSSHSITVSEHSTPFKQLLESTPNRLVQSRKFKKIERTTSNKNFFSLLRELKKSAFYPVIEYDRHTLVRHAQAEKFDETEHHFGFPQLLASCLFAIVQSANEIANIVSPLGAIIDIYNHRAKYSENVEDMGHIHVMWWIRGIAGFAAGMGFFVWGWRLTQCLGGKLTYMSNSRGLASQLCTVATVIIMTKLELPISSSHAFVGSLLGVGVADDAQNVNWKLFIKFLIGWVFTIVFCCGVAYGIYSFTIHSPAYVVPA